MVPCDILGLQIQQLLATLIFYKLGNLDDNGSFYSAVYWSTDEQSKVRFIVYMVYVEMGDFPTLDGLGVELYNQSDLLDDAVPILNTWDW